jgi:RNA polymerase sigma-70 factor, ECF subfamily
MLLRSSSSRMARGAVINARNKPQSAHLRALPEGDTALAEERSVADEEIIAGLVAGDEWAAEALYDRVHRVADRTLRRLLRASESDYEDLLQITFERIIRTLIERRFRGACNLSTWAAAIASRVGIDAFRSKMRARDVFDGKREADDGAIILGQSLERQLEARSEVEQLQSILSVMDPRQAETVVLHDLFGHELSEIAVLMGVSVAAAQSRLARGRKDLLRRVEIRRRSGR